MLVMLMKTSTPRVGDEENRFPAHYSEADQMARFSSTMVADTTTVVTGLLY